jgi:hypothetical protein
VSPRSPQASTLLSIVVLCAGGAAWAASATAFERIQVPTAWAVIAVGPHERSLEASHSEGGCAGPGVSSQVKESGTAVVVTVTEEVNRPQGSHEACPAFARVGVRFQIPLRRPLAGRVIDRAAPGGSLVPADFGGGSAAVAPRLIGFSPSDAERAVRAQSLRGHIRYSRRHRGLPRVIAQSPPPGASVTAGVAARYVTVMRLQVDR